MRKIISLTLALVMISILAVGCTSTDTPPSSSFDTSRTINVVSREDGSGTRGAFVEIVGILEKDASGNEVDRTYEEAVIQNATDGVLTTVAGDEYAVGYISLGSLNDTVKAVKIDGIEPRAENVQNGSYKIARPFNVAYKGQLNPLARDFLDFILSEEGQEVVESKGYVRYSTELSPYVGSEQNGNLVVAGSTSVTPVMEALAEAYREMYPGVTIEIQSTGSSAGMQSAIEGTAELGMASRDLKDSELELLTAEVIAIDGITIITNNNNPIEDLTIDEVKKIYIGEATEWSAVE